MNSLHYDFDLFEESAPPAVRASADDQSSATAAMVTDMAYQMGSLGRMWLEPDASRCDFRGRGPPSPPRARAGWEAWGAGDGTDLHLVPRGRR